MCKQSCPETKGENAEFIHFDQMYLEYNLQVEMRYIAKRCQEKEHLHDSLSRNQRERIDFRYLINDLSLEGARSAFST